MARRFDLFSRFMLDDPERQFIVLQSCATAQFRRFEFHKALETYNRIIREFPDRCDGFTFEQRGACFLRLMFFVRALRDFDTGVRRFGEDAEKGGWSCLVSRAHALSRIQDYDEAIVSYSRALLIRPEVRTLYRNRALMYCRNLQLPEALQDYNLALEEEMTPSLIALARSGRGFVLSMMGRHAKAEKDFRIAFGMADRMPRTCVTRLLGDRGLARMVWKDYSGAAEDYTSVMSELEANPDDHWKAIACFRRAFAYCRIPGKLEFARQDLIRSFELDADFHGLEAMIQMIPEFFTAFEGALPMFGACSATQALGVILKIDSFAFFREFLSEGRLVTTRVRCGDGLICCRSFLTLGSD